MDNDKNELTPMVRQYLDIKKEHQDKVLFFRLGDFYEMFNEDAVEISKLLNLTLTHRGTLPMCGIPYHACRNYLKRLLEYGKKVAICEQFASQDSTKKLQDRVVTKIYTPATVIDDEYLDSYSSSYITAINYDRKNILLSWADISTGEFKVTTLPLKKDFQNLESTLFKIESKEIIVPSDLYYGEKAFRLVIDSQGAMVSKLPGWYFTLKEGKKRVKEQFGESALRVMEITEKDPILSVIGALLDYMEENAKSSLPQFRYIEKVTDEDYMILNSATVRNLEIVRNLSDNSNQHTLFSSINRTKTPSGARFLKEELLHPLVDINKIKSRQDWIEKLVNDSDENMRVRSLLKDISDLERLAVKSKMKKLTPRDLIAISESTSSFLTLVEANGEYLDLVDESVNFNFSSLLDFSSRIIRAINRECTNINNSGTIIKDGYDSKLDELRLISHSGSSLLDDYLSKIKEETGIVNIKVGENRIIGCYLEVSKGQLDRVPESFIRRQTLVGGERFTTAELEKLQEEIVNSKDEEAKREREVFFNFVNEAFSITDEIEKMGKIITLLDFYSSSATCALEKNYTKPNIIETGEMEIIDGRHPVVEDYQENYIPNSFSSSSSRFSLITGPNMAGKSTYLREIALITLLAHIGYYVPAKAATIPLTDKIFCRVGAQDNLSKGESTFLVEMSEAAQILLSLTSRSLVIMDEIGRGTSTQDGMSIAYAIMQYLIKKSPITLFSTHYHELTMLDTSGIQLLHMAVLEDKNQIIFLRKAEKGVAASSYGIHVAKLAGLPREVINEANSFMHKHFADYSLNSDEESLFSQKSDEITLKDEIFDEVNSFDPNSSSPLECLLFINELKNKIKGE